MTPSSPQPEVHELKSQVVALSDHYRLGGRESYGAFRDLAAFLLSNTVLAETSHVTLTRLSGAHSDVRMALGGPGGPTDPLLLRNGWYLRLSVTLFLAEDVTQFLKVEKSAYQYQADLEGDRWVFRYDYLRQPGDDPHPTAHLQLRGSLAEEMDLPRGRLERVHFPTGRIAIEAVIRLLVEQFGCPTRLTSDLWRPMLAESERLFADIAHRPLSGPSA